MLLRNSVRLQVMLRVFLALDSDRFLFNLFTYKFWLCFENSNIDPKYIDFNLRAKN